MYFFVVVADRLGRENALRQTTQILYIDFFLFKVKSTRRRRRRSKKQRVFFCFVSFTKTLSTYVS
jgi:hypothetical protein